MMMKMFSRAWHLPDRNFFKLAGKQDGNKISKEFEFIPELSFTLELLGLCVFSLNYNAQNIVPTIETSYFIGTLSNLLVIIIGIKSPMSKKTVPSDKSS